MTHPWNAPSDETTIAAVGFTGEIHPTQAYTYLPHPDLIPGFHGHNGFNGGWFNPLCCHTPDDAVDLYDRYTLVRLEVAGQRVTVEELDRLVGRVFQVVTITPLGLELDHDQDQGEGDGHRSWEMLVLREYIGELRQVLRNRFPGSSLDSQYNPLEPGPEAVESLGLQRATQRCMEDFRDRVRQVGESHWYIGGAYYGHYLAVSDGEFGRG